jgi:hypothetical protein
MQNPVNLLDDVDGSDQDKILVDPVLWKPRVRKPRVRS